MTNRVEAFILKTQSGQWMVEVWRGGGPVECTAGLETELDAIEGVASENGKNRTLSRLQRP